MAEKTYQETRVNLLVTTGDVKEKRVSVEESDATSAIEQAQKEGNSQVEVLVSQTFLFHEVSDESPIEDFVALVPNVLEQANLINRAIVLKQQQHVRRLLVQDTYAPVEGVYDLRDIVGQMSERKTATPEQKAANAFSKLLGRTVTTEELATIIAAMGTTA